MKLPRFSFKTQRITCLTIAGIVTAFVVSATIAPAPSADGPQAVPDYGRVSLSFEANQGQADPQVRFLSRSRTHTLFLTSSEAVLALKDAHVREGDRTDSSTPPAVVRMRLAGANGAAAIEGRNPLAGRVNYYVGNDPTRWRTNIPTYGQVAYERVYEGVDVIYYGNEGNFEFDFVVAPGADQSVVRFTLADGAGNPLPLDVDAAGDLLVGGHGTALRLHRPRVHQQGEHGKIAVDGSYRLVTSSSRSLEVGFDLGAYDATKPLVIDPVISYSTYLGGSADDAAQDIAVDSTGNAYVVGRTSSADFPVAGALQSFGGGDHDVFISKLDASGTTLLYSTYLGGTTVDVPHAVAVDSAGRAYVAGFTSGDFPLVAPAQTVHAGDMEGFVATLNPDGTLAYSTYLGGSQIDTVRGIAADASGNAYVTGQTHSTDFPILNALQPIVGPSGGPFITKFTAAGTIAFSTFLGGTTAGDESAGIALDAGGNPVVTGTAYSTDFPVTPNAFQSSFMGNADAFVASITADGTAWRYATYFGGSDRDDATDVTVDVAGNPVITGRAYGPNLPITSNAAQPVFSGGLVDTYVAKLNSSATRLLYSTYIGGTGQDSPAGIAADLAGNVYVAGVVFLNSPFTSFPVRRAPQSTFTGFSDMYIAKLNTAGGPLLYATLWGGSGTDYEAAHGIAVDAAGNAYVAGTTFSSDFPIVNALQGHAGSGDAAIVKLAVASDLQITKTGSPNPVVLGDLLTYTITVANLEADAATNVRVTDVLPAGTLLASAVPSQGTCTGTTKVTCTLGVLDSGSATIQLHTRPISSNGGSITNTASVTSFEPDLALNNNSTSTTTTTVGGFQLRVSVDTPAGGTVKSSPAGIGCGRDCVETYVSNATVKLVAAPAVGYAFSHWTGACSGPNPACSLSMTTHRSTTAVFFTQ